MSSVKVCQLPGAEGREGQSTVGPTRKLTGSFFLNTSTSHNKTGANEQEASERRVNLMDPSGGEPGRVINHSKHRVSLVDPSTQTKKRRETLSVPIGPQPSIPLRFYEPVNNPFFKGDTMPALMNRSRDLIDADKAEEMYIWLGFESEEELEKLKRGELVLQFDDEDGSDTSSNAEL